MSPSLVWVDRAAHGWRPCAEAGTVSRCGPGNGEVVLLEGGGGGRLAGAWEDDAERGEVVEEGQAEGDGGSEGGGAEGGEARDRDIGGSFSMVLCHPGASGVQCPVLLGTVTGCARVGRGA
jgi:hypothetical protein